MPSPASISIQPVTVWNNGPKTVVSVVVTCVSYEPSGAATGFYDLLGADGKIITSSTVAATAAQTAAWSDDASFFRVLVQNAGLVPL